MNGVDTSLGEKMTIQDVQESATLAKIDGNHVNSVAMLSMIDFLASRPSIDEVAQHLVLSVVPHHKPRSAMISLFEHDGSLHAAGSFGLPHSAVNSLQKVSLWDNSPMVDSVRAGNPLVFLSQQSLAHSYPWLEREVALFQPTTAWPLTLRGHRMGALQLIFSDAPSADELASDLTGVVALLSFYLSLNNHESWQSQHEAPLDGQVRQIGGQFTASATRTQLTPAPLELSKRQKMVLTWMSKGCTNAQIAHRVGFSESTVRQETMAIYRYLGAQGRHDAVQIAHLRGLLEPLDAA